MPYTYTDDGQGQNTYVVIDEYGQHKSAIGLPFDRAISLCAFLNAEEIIDSFSSPVNQRPKEQ